MSNDRKPDLPPDVLQLLCQELGERHDFGTLFNCAMTGKDNYLARSAIEFMYKEHNKSLVLAGDVDLITARGLSGKARSDEQRRIISMWALQWRSIIRSSIGSTFYPYALYIRSLDLRNLEELLADSIFREAILESFFAGDMIKFLPGNDTSSKRQLRGSTNQHRRADLSLVSELVGESITSFVSAAATKNGATVALEDVAGHIKTISLQRWTSKLSKLKSLTLWDGSALNESVAASISANCLQFHDLTFFTCIPKENNTFTDTDHEMALFFSELRTDTLRSFSALSANYVGPETLLALNNHSKSLKFLKLDGLGSTSIKVLSALQACTALEALAISDIDGLLNLEATENDVFLDVVKWLSSCTNLRAMRMTNIVSAPAILRQVCLSKNIHLRGLELNEYTLVGNADLHVAISHQRSLESLKLQADPENASPDDIERLVTSISALTKLKYLNLVSTSDEFQAPQVLRLVSSLKELEELWFGGFEISDVIWPSLSNLVNLNSLNIHAFSTFTSQGILNYISTLGKKNDGFLLAVMNQSLDHNLTDDEQILIQETIAAQVDGHFEYVLFRDYESDEEEFSD